MSLVTIAPTLSVNIYTKQANQVGAQVGMPPMTPPKTVSVAAQAFEKAVKPLLAAQFNKDFPNNQLPEGQVDFGYMGPWSALKPGKTPPCVVDQITQDLQNWQIPVAENVVNQMAATITQSVYSHGGQPAVNKGVTQVSASESIDWAVLAGQFYLSETELGIIFIFAAAMDISIG